MVERLNHLGAVANTNEQRLGNGIKSRPPFRWLPLAVEQVLVVRLCRDYRPHSADGPRKDQTEPDRHQGYDDIHNEHHNGAHHRRLQQPEGAEDHGEKNGEPYALCGDNDDALRLLAR